MASKDIKIEFFLKRFNCAANRIINVHKKQVALTNTVKPVVTLPGIQKPSRYLKYWTRCQQTNEIHPLSELLVGKKIRGPQFIQLEDEYGLYSLIGEPFMQGFVNMPHYKDVWGGFDHVGSDAYYSSLMFSLGRFFLEKFSGISLEYKLPAKFTRIVKQLR